MIINAGVLAINFYWHMPIATADTQRQWPSPNTLKFDKKKPHHLLIDDTASLRSFYIYYCGPEQGLLFSYITRHTHTRHHHWQHW